MKIYLITFFTLTLTASLSSETWKIKSQADWKKNIQLSKGIVIEDSLVSPRAQSGHFKTKLKKFNSKKSLQSLIINQSPAWQNWDKIPGIGPSNLGDAPVFLAKGKSDYWMFGRYSNPKSKKGQKSKEFKVENAKLKGFDIPLKTTRDENQFNAPGGLKKGLGGYHAWQSRD
ncbi:MAG: hypothetical protein ACKVJ1_03380, partial [Verrucomicrobiia bacterium]